MARSSTVDAMLILSEADADDEDAREEVLEEGPVLTFVPESLSLSPIASPTKVAPVELDDRDSDLVWTNWSFDRALSPLMLFAGAEVERAGRRGWRVEEGCLECPPVERAVRLGSDDFLPDCLSEGAKDGKGWVGEEAVEVEVGPLVWAISPRSMITSACSQSR